MTIEPKMKQLSAFLVAGITVRTVNKDEERPESAKLPGLWSRFYSEALAAEVPHAIAESPIYGVYHDYEADFRARYSVTAGVAVSAPADGGEFETVQVPAGTYLVFEGKGAMPQIVAETWKSVWDYFQDNNHFKRAYTTDFELYAGEDEVAIHIAV